MSTRLATADDTELLGGMLARMGQPWSENAIREALAKPWITVIHETDGKPDGFYCLRCAYDIDGTATLGPGDGPRESHEAWLRAICEMGIAIEDEVLRRYPKINPAKCWVQTTMWPERMGPLNAYIKERFGWLPEPDAGPTSAKEGYRVLHDGGELTWVRRTNLVARAKSERAKLERPR